MIKYSLIISLSCYTGVMFLLGLTVGLVVAIIVPRGFEWSSLGISFVCVFLAGLISQTVTGVMRRRGTNDIVSALTGTVFRTGIVAVFIVVIIVTQRKDYAFCVLCFSILFYLGMIALNAWLVMPAKINHRETDSNRG